jgi:Ca2+-binding EF-hand superfamily protein
MNQWLVAAGLLAGLGMTGMAAAGDEEKAPPRRPMVVDFFKGQDLNALFKKLDADRDGKLSREEFQKLPAELGPAFQAFLKDKPGLLDKMFEKLDRDKLGHLTPTTFATIAKIGPAAKPRRSTDAAIAKDPEALFQKMAGGKDRVSKEQFCKYFDEHLDKEYLKLNPDFSKKLFERLDADKDGFLTLAEFKQLSKLREERAKARDKK